MRAVRLLCVDDDPAIRQLLPAILGTQGYQVMVASSVSEALAEIAAQPFDVLIADLNIGEPGDGFTVVSAMRRTHPNCVNLIMTGYPALETALQSIRMQVDNVLVKPTNIGQLLNLIDEKLNLAKPPHPPAIKSLSDMLRESTFEITRRSLSRMRAHPQLAALSLSDEERISMIPAVLHNLAATLESIDEDEATERVLCSAAALGRLRHSQGYTIPLLMENVRIVENTVADVIRENLASLDLSRLWSDIQRLNNGAILHIQELLKSYVKQEQCAA